MNDRWFVSSFSVHDFHVITELDFPMSHSRDIAQALENLGFCVDLDQSRVDQILDCFLIVVTWANVHQTQEFSEH